MNGTAHFRFLDLSKEEADELKSTISSAEIGTHYKSGNFVGSVELSDTNAVFQISEFRIKHRISTRNCDVFISIASDKRDETWRAPKTVNYTINVINCPLVFSYTC